MRLTTPLFLALSATTASAHTVGCFPFKDMALTPYIYDGIKYLRAGDIESKAHLPPNSCSRVSCSYGAAIYWCNTDKQNDKEIGFYNIADGAQTIVNDCSSHDGRYAGGVVDHPDSWQALVFRDEESC